MRKFNNKSIVFTAIKQAFVQREVSAALLYSVIILVALFIITLPFSRQTQGLLFEKFQLKTRSFVQWSVLQVIPSMYSFANEVWKSPVPFSDQFDPDQIPANQPYQHYWINHYPLRYITFSLTNRQKYIHLNTPYYINIRSRYHNNQLVSSYRINPKANRLYIEKIN